MPPRPLTTSDIDAVTDLLVSAFSSDPGFRYIIPDDDEWPVVAARYFRLAATEARTQGLALVDPGLCAVSLWESPQDERAGTRSLLRQWLMLVRVALILRGNLGRALDIHQFIAKYRPTRPHWYLTYIATSPGTRNQGFGTGVLRPVLDLATNMQLPVYLECSNRQNLPFYLGHGFHLVDEVSVPGGGHVWPMIREPL